MARAPKKAAQKAARRTRGKRPAAEPSATAAVRQGAPAAAAMSASGYRAKVRMYRQGLGDCFLIALPRADRSDRPFYLMIDCGVVLGTASPEDKMTEVMEHIVSTTGGEIDILAATHEHWDHLSGFNQAKLKRHATEVSEAI